MNTIYRAGFRDAAIQKEKRIVIPDSILGQYLNEKELVEFKRSGAAIISVTVYGRKPE